MTRSKQETEFDLENATSRAELEHKIDLLIQSKMSKGPTPTVYHMIAWLLAATVLVLGLILWNLVTPKEVPQLPPAQTIVPEPMPQTAAPTTTPHTTPTPFQVMTPPAIPAVSDETVRLDLIEKRLNNIRRRIIKNEKATDPQLIQDQIDLETLKAQQLEQMIPLQKNELAIKLRLLEEGFIPKNEYLDYEAALDSAAIEYELTQARLKSLSKHLESQLSEDVPIQR